jgi:hypothetical protein
MKLHVIKSFPKISQPFGQQLHGLANNFADFLHKYCAWSASKFQQLQGSDL